MDVDLIARLRKAAERLFAARNILAAYAFGSRVSRRPRPDSDLVVGYYLLDYRSRRTLSLKDEMLLAADLSDATGVDVDLRDLAPAPLELRGRVLEEGIRIYSGEDLALVALERDLLSRYLDYKDIYREMHDLRLRELARRSG